MSREDAKKILGEGATEEQITNFLNNYHINESSKIKDLEKQLSDLRNENNKYSDYDEMKTKLDSIEREKMTEQEKIELAKKEAIENLEKSKIILNTTKAKEILAGLDLDEDTISMLVSSDSEKTISNATKLKQKFDSMREIVAKETKENLVNQDLKPTITNVNQNEDVMTLEKFSNLSAEEQNKFMMEHPQEFENL